MVRQCIDIDPRVLKELQATFVEFRQLAKAKYKDIGNMSFENYLVYILRLGHKEVQQSIK